MNNDPNTRCALCNKNAVLQQSHIVPAFVFRWLRETSATGFIRFGEAPNKRVQDGAKLPLLCAACEAHLSQFEAAFANNLFHPWNANSEGSIRYGSWSLKFCVSISWRVLKYFSIRAEFTHFNAKQKEMTRNALERWSQFLLGSAPHPAGFEQHLLPLDRIESHTIGRLPNNINRYFLRAVDMDVVASEESALTYAKLGRFAIFGFIQPPSVKWKGTKVHVRDGVVGPREYLLPATLLEYLCQKAERYQQLQSKISDRQQDRIEQAVMSNAERFHGSETLKAMLEDQRLFGTDAILRQPRTSKDDQQ